MRDSHQIPARTSAPTMVLLAFRSLRSGFLKVPDVVLGAIVQLRGQVR